MEDEIKKLRKLYNGLKLECILAVWDELDEYDRETLLEGIDDPVCDRCACGCEAAIKAAIYGVHPADLA